MPRYYFHLHGSGANDLDGEDFPDNAAAIAEAKQVARELPKNQDKGSHPGRIVVTDEKGETIHEEPLDEH
jgi:hypothetical protein